MKLILCAGTRHIEGYTHHDVTLSPGIDIQCDLHDIEKFVEHESCERIEFTHALEHFPQKESVPMLQMIRGLLQEGGELYLEVPNFRWHAELLLKEGRDRDAVYYAFGGQLDQYDFHKNGFTVKILQEDLELAGFKDIEVLDHSSLIATAKK